MNKTFKLFGFAIFAIALVFTVFSIVSVSADGTINLILNSPEDGNVYNLTNTVFFSATVDSSIAPSSVEVYANLTLPDGTSEIINFFQDGTNFIYDYNPSMAGDYKATVYAHDPNGNWDVKSRIFFVKDTSPPPSPNYLEIVSPEDGETYNDYVTDFAFNFSIDSSSSLILNCWYVLNGVQSDDFSCTQGANVYSGISTVEGVNKLKVYAEDVGNGVVVSDAVSFTINTNPPSGNLSIEIVSPYEDQEFIIGSVVNIKAKVVSDSIANLPENVWIVISLPNGLSYTEELSTTDNVLYTGEYSSSLPGNYKLEFFAEDQLGNVAYAGTYFVYYEGIPPGSFQISVNSPLDGSVHDLYQDVLFSANITGDSLFSAYTVWADVTCEGGASESLTLNLNSEGNYVSYFTPNAEGNCKAIFYANDSLGNMDSEKVNFEIKDNSGDDGNGGTGGGSGEDGSGSTRYYLCIEWSSWGQCVDGFQDRVCTKEIMTLIYRDGVSLHSQLGVSQERTCVVNSFENENGESGFRSWLTGGSIGSLSAGGFLVILIFLVLVLLLAIIVALMKRRKF